MVRKSDPMIGPMMMPAAPNSASPPERGQHHEKLG
jgi:hypothetical protein